MIYGLGNLCQNLHTKLLCSTIFQIKVLIHYAGGFLSLSNKILFFLDQRIYSIFSGWKQLLHLCNKRGLGKGGRRGGNQFPVVWLSWNAFKHTFLGHMEIHLRQLWDEVEVRNFYFLKMFPCSCWCCWCCCSCCCCWLYLNSIWKCHLVSKIPNKYS